MMRSSLTRLLLATAAMSVSTAVFAAEGPAREKPGGFSGDTSITQTFSYDSNPLRLNTNEDALFGSTTSPELTLRWRSPVSIVESETRVDVNVFDDSDYDSTDLEQKLYLQRRNERWTASLRGSFAYDTTRTSEETNYTVNIPKVRTTRLTGSPEIAFKSSEQSRWVIGADATTVHYDNAAYTDYDFYMARAAYEYNIDPLNTLSFGVNGQHYEATEGAGDSSDSIGPTIGWIHVINPRLALRAYAGALATTKNAGGGSDEDTWNYVFSGSATYRGDQDVFDFTVSRSRAPFGNGTETLLDSVSIEERHRLNELVTLKANAKYQQADYETSPGINLEHSYGGGLGIAYRITEKTEIGADYRYRREQLTNVADDIDQHMVLINLSYAPNWIGD